MSKPDIPDGLVFRKAEMSTSNGGGCGEVAFTADAVYMRNSTDSAGTTIKLTHFEWTCFLDGVKKQEFELPGTI